MVYGVGTDIIDIHRIERTLARLGTRFVDRVFTPQEQIYCEENPRFRSARYAKRFAAKEACLKAMGTGYRDPISWHDIEVTRTKLGKPELLLTGQALRWLSIAAGTQDSDVVAPFRYHLSLSDTQAQAQAFVIIEQQQG